MPSSLKIALKSSPNTIPAVQNMLYPTETHSYVKLTIYSAWSFELGRVPCQAFCCLEHTRIFILVAVSL